MEEKKENNNTIWIIILIVGLIVLAIVGYFTYTKSKADKDDNLTPNTTENTDKDKDADKSDKDVVGTYSSKDDNSLGDDIKDATEGTDTTKTMELVLESDKTAKVAHLADVVSGTYTVDSNKITVTIQNNTTDTTDTDKNDTTSTDSRKSTYEFTRNSDDTLSHTDDSGKTITLKKINKSDLKYIK